MKSTNSAASIVSSYGNHKMLKELGYNFDGNDLTYFDVECYNIIESKISSLEKLQAKKK